MSSRKYQCSISFAEVLTAASAKQLIPENVLTERDITDGQMKLNFSKVINHGASCEFKFHNPMDSQLVAA
jgi:hypothetical protein